MKMWPRSLFGRLSLLLFGVLVIAQLIVLAIQFSDRNEVFYRAVGQPLAQRIAEQVQALDGLAPAARRGYAEQLSFRRQRVRLAASPTLDDAGRFDWRSLVLTRLLRGELGDQRPLSVAIEEHDVPFPHLPGSHPARRHPMEMPSFGDRFSGFSMPPREGLWIHVEVGLSGGDWVRFSRLLPPAAFVSPRPLLLGIAVTLLAVLGVSLFAVRWMTRPLQHLADAADRLGRDLNMPPLAERGPLEMVRAARAFNTMQGRLARLVNDRARILAAISHDLKTPLTRLRLRAEMLDDDAQASRIRGDVDDMERLVNTTLDFMRDAAGDEPLQLTDIDALVGSMAADYDETGHRIEVTGAVSRPLAIRPLALKRCLANVIDNALKYGGAARIGLEESVDQLAITVADDGPGIPDEQLEQVFEPFHRIEQSRSRETGGTGLGLSIARSIARAHGGDLTLANGDGGGLVARLVLPRR